MNLEQLTETVDRLRCDLSATWQVLGAMQTILTPEQRQNVLTALAVASAKKQALYDAPQATPEAQARVQHYGQLMQASETRLYEMLQGAAVQFQPPPSR